MTLLQRSYTVRPDYLLEAESDKFGLRFAKLKTLHDIIWKLQVHFILVLKYYLDTLFL